ncbi:MAG: hypothetical protein US16_C0005G0022 [Candidatus Moranbacteria bacterium GW2011_GWE2_36_40]|nr:MAG: hypothetical protein US16_C0005G0022 [Candidatus Moranbacteria bacterium GW2011_GWE2_36_40]
MVYNIDMDREKIKKIIADGENSNVEFKLSFSDDVITTLVAMTNRKGGLVIVGVNDKRKISGVKLDQESVQNWTNEIKNKTQPFLSVDIEKFVIDKKTIVVFDVAEFPLKPVSFKGRFYVRKNNSNHLLTLQEISEMYLRTKNSSWDFYPNRDKSLDDLDTEKIEKTKLMIEKNLAVSLGDNFSFLRKYSLIVEDDGSEYPTNASLLLFLKEPSRQTDIQIGLFQNDITIKKDKVIRRDLISEVDEVMEFVKIYILKEFIITGNPQREERWQYPIDAIREIVINAIIHRDYQEGTHSQFRVYFDKLEFWNSGWLPFDLTLDDVKAGRRKSTPRNKLVAEIFRDYGLPEPFIEEASGGFCITIFSKEFEEASILKSSEKSVEKAAQKSSEKSSEKGSEKSSEKILNLMRKRAKISAKEVAEKLGISSRAVEKQIAKLREEKLIKRIGSDKGGYWEVVKK